MSKAPRRSVKHDKTPRWSNANEAKAAMTQAKLLKTNYMILDLAPRLRALIRSSLTTSLSRSRSRPDIPPHFIRACSEEVVNIIVTVTSLPNYSVSGCESSVRMKLMVKLYELLEKPRISMDQLADLLHTAFWRFSECLCKSPSVYQYMPKDVKKEGDRAPAKLQLGQMMQAIVEAYPNLPPLKRGHDGATVSENCQTLKDFFESHEPNGPDELRFCKEIQKQRYSTS